MGRGNPSQTLSFCKQVPHLLHPGPSCAPFFKTGVCEHVGSGSECASLQSISDSQGALEGSSREFLNILEVALQEICVCCPGQLFECHLWSLRMSPHWGRGRKTMEAEIAGASGPGFLLLPVWSPHPRPPCLCMLLLLPLPAL